MAPEASKLICEIMNSAKLFFVLLMVLYWSALLAQSNPDSSINPPYGLKWDDNYESAKARIKSSGAGDKIRVGELYHDAHEIDRFFPDKNVLKGHKIARIRGLHMFDEECEEAIAVFDDSSKLVLIQLRFYYEAPDKKQYKQQARRMSDLFYKLRAEVSKKYGEPKARSKEKSDWKIGEHSFDLWESKVNVLYSDQLKLIWYNRGRSLRLQKSGEINFGGGKPVSDFEVYLQFSSAGWNAGQPSDL